jgi:hypothetical protein
METQGQLSHCSFDKGVGGRDKFLNDLIDELFFQPNLRDVDGQIVSAGVGGLLM